MLCFQNTPVCIIICLTFAELRFCLDLDVAVRAVDDAVWHKIPTIFFHAFDCRLVLAGEGNAIQYDAILKRRPPDARHA